ncbi:MAG: beta-lactamase family protein [Eudoraea sp.]|nr:beta-lactamase family protein [Eudoraea sp.]
MKSFKRLAVIILVLLLAIIAFQYPKLTIISGYAAKNMASSAFVAGRSVASIAANDNNVPMIKLAETEVNKKEKSVTASVLSLMQRKAICRDGLGCALVIKGADRIETRIKPDRLLTANPLPFPYGNGEARDTIFPEVNYKQLEAAINKAFDNPEVQNTRTLLVAYKDQILSERYEEGFGPQTPILGWSMTKSVLATLFGILEYQGRIDLNSPAPVNSWQQDMRKDITLNHLLRMQSGLSWEEDYTKISDVTRMLFMSADMTKLQEDKEALAKPGDIWNYSSGTSNLLSGVLREQFPSHQDYLNFPYQELIDKIGMSTMLIEADLSGNFVGSSYAWASTRDWAKFGLLYLHNGHWNGEQLFDKNWVAYISRPTAHSDGTYGAHFWLNAEGKYPGVPRDLYSANGYQGQYVFIIPSKDLVIVRTGLAEPPDFDLNTFLKEIVAAFP